MDSLQREQSQALEAFIEVQLHNMASRGLYDHVHGGFHRYVSDSHWAIPHYEKMLYTQAMMMMVYSSAFQLFGDQMYEQVVRETLVFLLNFMRNQEGGFASAIDAVFQGREGGYYLYDIESFSGFAEQALIDMGVSLYQKNDKVGLHRLRKNSDRFRPLKRQLAGIHDKSALLIDEKVLTSWNGLLIWALSHAYEVFDDDLYKQNAIQLGKDIWRLNIRDEQLYRSSFKAIFSQLATFEDFVVLSRAYISLYQITQEPIWINRAQWLFEKAKKVSESGITKGRMKDTLNVYADAEMLNPLALHFEVAALLSEITGTPDSNTDSKNIMRQLKSAYLYHPYKQFYSLKMLREAHLGSIRKTHFFARGNGRGIQNNQVNCSYAYIVEMAPGWHINSNTPLSEDLLATSLMSSQGAFSTVSFPEQHIVKYGEQQENISVFENKMSIVAQGGRGVASLKVQACSVVDNICLMPETMLFPLNSQCSTEQK